MQQQLIILQPQQVPQAVVEVDSRRVEDERRRAEVKKVSDKKLDVKKDASKEHVIKKEVVKVTKTESTKKRKPSSSSSSFRSLSELHTLRLKLEAAEDSLSQHVHICLGDDGVNDCTLRISQLEVLKTTAAHASLKLVMSCWSCVYVLQAVQCDIISVREEYLRLKEHILRELEATDDPDKAQFLSSELGVINRRLESLESSSSAYLQRYMTQTNSQCCLKLCLFRKSKLFCH